MSTNPGPEKPFQFTSETLNSLIIIGLTIVVMIPCVLVVIVAFRDIRGGITARRILKKSGKLKGGGIHDVENQLGEKTNLELSGYEKNGGLCELEQPGLPELSAIGIVEMWDEGCAKEIGGKIVAVELDADEQSALATEVPNRASDVDPKKRNSTEIARVDRIDSAVTEMEIPVAD